MSSQQSSQSIRSIERLLDSYSQQDLDDWNDGTLQRKHFSIFASKMTKSMASSALAGKIAQNKQHTALVERTSEPLIIEKTGEVAKKVVILSQFSVTIQHAAPDHATDAVKANLDMDMRHQLLCDIAGISTEKEALECLASCLVYLHPEGWKQDVFIVMLQKTCYGLRILNPPPRPRTPFDAELAYKEIVAFVTLGLLMMGKNVGGEAANISAFLQLRIKAIASTLGVEQGGTWESQDTAKFIANGTDSKKTMRTYFFNYLLSIHSASPQEVLEKGVRLAFEYLKNAFITTLAAVVNEILECGYGIYVIREAANELQAVTNYVSAAIALAKPNWTYVRMSVPESDLRPLPAGKYPILASVALALAAEKSTTIARVPTPNLTICQKRAVSKILATIRSVRRAESDKQSAGAVALGGGNAELMETVTTSLDKFIPHDSVYIGPDRPVGVRIGREVTGTLEYHNLVEAMTLSREEQEERENQARNQRNQPNQNQV